MSLHSGLGGFKKPQNTSTLFINSPLSHLKRYWKISRSRYWSIAKNLHSFLINLFPLCKPPHLNNLNVFIKLFQDFLAPTLIFQLSLFNWHCRPLQTNLPERISKNMLKPDYAFQFGSLNLFWLLKGISLLKWQRPKSCHTFNFLHCLQLCLVASEDAEIKMLNF